MFEVLLSKKVMKQLADVAISDRKRIGDFLTALEAYPEIHHLGTKKLQDQPSYRGRVGNYRVIFEVDGINRKILVTRVMDRKDVYR